MSKWGVGVLSLAVLLGLSFYGVNGASAQSLYCDSRESLVERLWQKWREVSVGFGVNSQGVLIELFVSDAGSWSILLSRPDGISCLIDAGEDWGRGSGGVEPPIEGAPS